MLVAAQIQVSLRIPIACFAAIVAKTFYFGAALVFWLLDSEKECEIRAGRASQELMSS
jgi:hypothetical protein